MTANLEIKKWASNIAMKHGAELYHTHKLRLQKIKNGPPTIDTTPPCAHPLVKRRLMESIKMAKKIEKENRDILFRLADACQKSSIDNKLSSHIEDYRIFTRSRIHRERMIRAQKITKENRILENRIINARHCLSFI